MTPPPLMRLTETTLCVRRTRRLTTRRGLWASGDESKKSSAQMRVTVALRAFLCTLGLNGCGNDCMTFPALHLLTVPPDFNRSEPIQCCGDARQFVVAQANNDNAIDIGLQARSATNNSPIPGLRLRVTIDHCEAARTGDCTPVADQTTPSKVPSDVTASVSGRNIRLVLTVTNDQSTPGGFLLDVTQGHTCQNLL
jgi:hypothetical protein